MKRFGFALSIAVAFFFAARLAAQEPPTSKPEKEHEWLKQFVGEWESTAKTVASPDQPEMTCKGTASYKMLGDLWLMANIDADMAGAKFQALQTIGYDPKTKKFVGTWVDSMMNHLWHYEGTVDAAGKKLSLEAEGPSFMSPDETMRYRDSYEFKSKDEIIAVSSILGPDGKWIEFMSGTMVRKK